MSRSFYTVLQVHPDATPDEIKEAYRSLAWEIQSEGDQEALGELNAAYSCLSNPERRAEYDRSLTAGSTVAASVVTPTAQPAAAPRPEPPAQGPGFHPFLRVFGMLAQISYFISRIRYVLIPLNLVLGVVAVFGIFSAANSYVEAPSLQVPHPTTLRAVFDGTDSHQYITINGNLDHQASFRQSIDNVVSNYYALVAGTDVIYVKGRNLPASAPVTGKLTEFTTAMRKLVEEDAKDPQLPKGIRIDTVNYLDLDYTPTQPVVYLVGLCVAVLAALVLLIPPFFRFAIFSPRRGRASDLSATGPKWPVGVLATGRFTVENTGKRSLEVGIPAFLVRTGDPGSPLAVRFDRITRSGQSRFVLPIPAGAAVEWGYNYGGGRPLPAVSFRKGSWSARVCVPTEADAMWIAERFATGSLNA